VRRLSGAWQQASGGAQGGKSSGMLDLRDVPSTRYQAAPPSFEAVIGGVGGFVSRRALERCSGSGSSTLPTAASATKLASGIRAAAWRANTRSDDTLPNRAIPT
jgi:hypothetical protein